MADDYDEIMDSLPPHLRNKVLGELSGSSNKPPQQAHAPNKTSSRPSWWYLAFMLAVVWSAIAGIAGIALLFVIPPLGLLVICLAGAPGALLLIWEPDDSGTWH